jgi:hypothetical protein
LLHQNVSISDNVTPPRRSISTASSSSTSRTAPSARTPAGPNIWLRDSANTSLRLPDGSVTFERGEISGGTVLFDGLARNVLLELGRPRHRAPSSSTIPTGAIILRGLHRAFATTLTGDTTKLERQTTRERAR